MRASVVAAALAGAVSLAAAAAGAGAAPAPPPLAARAYVLVSGVDGATLAARAADEPRPIASITKLMTVLVALDHLRLDDVVAVPEVATGIGESSVELRAGERLSVRELVLATLVPSANDAATTLAYAASGGSIARFVAWMNERARALGLAHTHFANPHGLDAPGHVASARDVVRLLRAALALPVVRRDARMVQAAIAGGRQVVTTDDLLRRFPPLLAGKTGHTAGAGWSEVAAARLGRVTVYGAVLGEPSRERRNDDLQALLAWGLGQYGRVLVADPRRVYAVARSPYGRPAVRLRAARRVVRLQRVGRPLLERVVAPVEVRLPVRRGERLGEVRVYERGRLVARSPLVADRSVARPGLLGRVGWYATRTLHHLASLVT
ncbi:MAG TPA: serine hydrolase [Gaiellaceae bacterium]|nr:serine hydrolase [Gaiellaceae bacterium]